MATAGPQHRGTLEIMELKSPGDNEFRRLLGAILQDAVPTSVVQRAPRGARSVIVARDQDGPLAMVPYTVNADGTAQVGRPLIHPRGWDSAAEVLAAAAKMMARHATLLVLTLEEPLSRLEDALVRAAFVKGPKFIEVECPARRGLGEPEGRWINYRPEDRKCFAEVFYATLLGSLDAPELPVCPDGDRLMRSFEERGSFQAEDFSLLVVDDTPAGIVLLVNDAGAVEIIYIGVVPLMRRRGIGALLMKRAFWRAEKQGAGRLKAYVDAGNLPALALYRDFGFSEKRAVSLFYAAAKNFSLGVRHEVSSDAST